MFNPYDMQNNSRLGSPQSVTPPSMGSLGVGGGIYGNPFQVNQFSQPSGLTLQNPYSQQGMGMGQRYPEQTQQQMQQQMQQQGMNQNPMGFMGQPQQGMGLMGMGQPPMGQMQMSQGMNQNPMGFMGQSQQGMGMFQPQQMQQQGANQNPMGFMGQPPMPPLPSPSQPNASMQQGRGAMLNQPMNMSYGIGALNPSNYMSQR